MSRWYAQEQREPRRDDYLGEKKVVEKKKKHSEIQWNSNTKSLIEAESEKGWKEWPDGWQKKKKGYHQKQMGVQMDVSRRENKGQPGLMNLKGQVWFTG